MNTHNWKLIRVFRRDAYTRMFRLCRLVWQTGKVGDGRGYSSQLSLALMPKLFWIERGFKSIRICLLGIRVHFERSFGGIHI